MNHYKERLNGAMKKPLVERKQSLDRLIVTLESVKKLDRLSPIKRQTFLSLINMSMAKGEHDNAVYWTDKWIEFDEKDLVAKLKKGQILYGIPGRKSEGRLILKELNSRYPDVKKISDNYTKMMEIEGY
ncbi:MAG: hypothetical protein IMF07_05645 [Proteobacteria bacterium]|nr:hypothetical protein [Pseudomonadota bacterium]